MSPKYAKNALFWIIKLRKAVDFLQNRKSPPFCKKSSWFSIFCEVLKCLSVHNFVTLKTTIMKRISFAVLFIINRSKLKKNGDVPIIMRVSIGGQRAECQIKRHINPELWDATKERSKGRSKEAIELNEYLEMLKLRAYTVHRDLELTGCAYNARLVLHRVFNVQSSSRSVLSVFKKHNDDCRDRIGVDYVAITISRFDNCYKYLQKVIREFYGKEDINFNELSGDFVRAFEKFLRTERGCQQNTVIRYMKCFKKIVNMARAKNWLNHDPFYNIKFTEVKVIKEILTVEEIKTIMDKELIGRLEAVRDVFVFCCFTGLAYTDVNNLREEHITADGQGEIWIRKTREKTDNMCDIPLLGIPKSILEKYKGHALTDRNKRLLPVISNQPMNGYLKEIATLCGINKRLTTHTARHTYATVICLNNGVSINNVAKMLGHSDIRMSQHYARVMDNGLKKDMDNIKRIFG